MVDAFTRLNAPQNMAGVPALSIPCGKTNGIPVGSRSSAPPGVTKTRCGSGLPSNAHGSNPGSPRSGPVECDAHSRMPAILAL